MSSKFSEILEKNKIDPRRLIAASRKLERLRPEDRKIRLARRREKSGEAPAEGAEKPGKPRSGRPVTAQLIEAARAGKPVSGPAKTRLLRALNAVLEQKKLEKVDLRAVF
ncbi:MAG: hypothetical protein DIU78_003345 [Pseudomonadota bacterium]|nr:MAG: hypothetical protein DIU78_16460 [Pseudomonadota bacterium]